MLIVASNHHLLFHKLERVGRDSLRHDVAWHTKTILKPLARHALECSLLVNHLRYCIMLTTDKGGRRDLATDLVGINIPSEHGNLVLGMLLRARLHLPRVHAAVSDDRSVVAVAPIESIDHESHIASPLLLLL